MANRQIIDQDIERVLELTHDLWEELRGERLFITGGTGFFGQWLLESFTAANHKFKLQAEATILTRNINNFKNKFLDLAQNPAIKCLEGDVKNFNFPKQKFSYIIHAAATSAAETFNQADLLSKYDTVVNGTRHVLEFARACGAKKFLYTSSGAVYGKQPPDISNLLEDYPGAPKPNDLSTLAAWGNNKRAAEFLCAYYNKQYGIETKIARCFSFIGPGLPLDIHYAAGNFIANGLKGQEITILGDGTPRRSYLYTADLVVWLWSILLNGQASRPYNVGSEESVSILELAKEVADNFKDVKISVAKIQPPNAPIDVYVPSTQRAQTELKLKPTFPLKEAIARTIDYYKN